MSEKTFTRKHRIQGVLIGLGLALSIPLLAQTPTIFNAIRVNTTSDLRGNISNATGDVTINDNLVITGTCTGCAASFPLLAPNGDIDNASYSFAGDPDSGLWRAGADDIVLSTGGSGSVDSGFLNLTPTGIVAIGGDMALYANSGDIDLNLPNGDVNINLAAGGTFTVDNLIYGIVGDTFPGLSLQAASGAIDFTPWETSRGMIDFLVSPGGSLGPGGLAATALNLNATSDVTLATNTMLRAVSRGSTSDSSYSWDTDDDTGLYSPAANQAAISAGGTQAILFTSTLTTVPISISLTGSAITANGVVTTDNSSADEVGYKGIPQNSQSGNYTLVLTDAATHIYHPSGGGAGDTFTIPANSSVAYPVGTVVTFINDDTNSVSIAITTDTMTLAGSTSTGTRTLADNGIATAIKVTSTSWIINGTGITAVFEPLNPLNDDFYDQEIAA